MNVREIDEWADRKSESGVLKLIARWGMLASIPVIMGITTWVGSTLWVFNSELAKMRGEFTGRLDVLTERVGTNLLRSSDLELVLKLRDQRIEYVEKSIVEIRQQMSDHASRLRRLEQK